MPKITTFLAYESQAEEAARFYVSVFKNSKIGNITRYTETGPAPAGGVMVVTFSLDGQDYVALNGGPHFQFTDAVSLSIECKSQAEVDEYWTKLSAGGEQLPCGWLRDRFGLYWQVTPTALVEMLGDPDPAKAARVMTAMLQMKKIDIPALERAYAGR